MDLFLQDWHPAASNCTAHSGIIFDNWQPTPQSVFVISFYVAVKLYVPLLQGAGQMPDPDVPAAVPFGIGPMQFAADGLSVLYTPAFD